MKRKVPANPVEPIGPRQARFRRRLGVRIFAISFGALLCGGVIVAPLLVAAGMPLPAGLLYLSFAPVCHQNPERSFLLLGHAWAVCHRCSGIYLGLLGGMLLPSPASATLLRWRRAFVVAATSILVADFLSNYAGLLVNTPWSRFTSGLLFGAVAAVLVLRGMSELLSTPLVPPDVHALHGEIR